MSTYLIIWLHLQCSSLKHDLAVFHGQFDAVINPVLKSCLSPLKNVPAVPRRYSRTLLATVQFNEAAVDCSNKCNETNCWVKLCRVLPLHDLLADSLNLWGLLEVNEGFYIGFGSALLVKLVKGAPFLKVLKSSRIQNCMNAGDDPVGTSNLFNEESVLS